MSVIHVIFVHGTSVRKSRYVDDFTTVQVALKRTIGDYTINIHGCPWGEIFGAQLNAGGKSIPSYDRTRKPQNPPSETAYNAALWEVLFHDPYYELDLVSLQPVSPSGPLPPGNLSPGEELFHILSTFDPQHISFYPYPIEASDLAAARTALISDKKIEATIKAAGHPLLNYRQTLARALVVLSYQHAIYRVSDLDPAKAIELHPDSRDTYQHHLVVALGGYEGGLFEWVKNTAWRLVSPAVFHSLTQLVLLPKRGALSDGGSAFFADIIMYQGRGQEIRDYITAAVLKAGNGPKVLLAHSLGGIACIDALVQNQRLREEVRLLFTFGSQSPLFYEWNALASLRWGQPLPRRFPKWVNIWDGRDMLAYVAEGVFPNGDITDKQVDNHCPFPDSHSAYIHNPDVWNIIRQEIEVL